MSKQAAAASLLLTIICTAALAPDAVADCRHEGAAVLTNAVFETAYQAVDFARHHDVQAMIQIAEPEQRVIVFFNSAPVCLHPDVDFAVVHDSGAALAVYFAKPETITKGIYSRGGTWVIWWLR